MWALLRAHTPLRHASLSIRPFFGRSLGARIGTLCSCSKLAMPNAFVEEEHCVLNYSHSITDRHLLFPRFDHIKCFSSKPYGQLLSSESGAECSGVEDGFLELERPMNESKKSDDAWDDSEGELISYLELSDDNDYGVEEPARSELNFSKIETIADKLASQREAFSELFKAIILSPGKSVCNALDKWVKDGNDFSRLEISVMMLILRKRRMFRRALQFLEWLEANKQLDFVERDYASLVDLISKVHGLYEAENYIEKIPQSFRGAKIYRTLLANCSSMHNLKKAEEVFNKMKEMGFRVTSFACDQLLILYKRSNKKKIADVLFLMEKENVKPSLFTYQILIDTKGQSNDLTGMEHVVEMMKAEGMEPDVKIKAILARHYTAGGFKAKAQTVLKDIEGDDLKQNRWVCKFLLPLYAELQMSDEVERVWKVCEANPKIDECLAAIVAWGKLKNITEAEAILDRMKQWKKLSPRHYGIMLKVCAEHKLLLTGKDIIKRMEEDDGCKIGPLTWDSLVKLYLAAGEVEAASSFLHKAAQNNQMKPLYNSYLAIMDEYAKRGDVHNTEKTFHTMKMGGYIAGLRPFQALLLSYMNAGVPAYGMRERMGAYNIFPSKAVAAQLALVHPFRKPAVSIYE